MARYSRKVYRTNTVIIGAGAAGLAAGACLRRHNVPIIILEQDYDIGSSWLKRYERLHLHTHKRHSCLPYLSFPRDYPPYPSRLQVADYLELYAESFNLKPFFGERVRSIMRMGNVWSSRAKKGDYISRNLIIATGYNHKPVLPSWPGMKSFTGQVLHSSKYTNGAGFEGQDVLVVGMGNSGGEIAVDLHEYGARVGLSIRGPVNIIPRDVLGISSHTLSVGMRRFPAKMADSLSAPLVRMSVGDITELGLEKASKGPIAQIIENDRVPLIDVGTVQLIKQGHIKIFKEIEQIKGEIVHFKDGTEKAFDVIILATGFKPGVGAYFRDLNLITNENGVLPQSGHPTSMPGLYLCGFRNAPEGLLREIGIEAKRIARKINRSDKSIPEETEEANEKKNPRTPAA